MTTAGKRSHEPERAAPEDHGRDGAESAGVADAVLDLQRRAGNAAVAGAIADGGMMAPSRQVLVAPGARPPAGLQRRKVKHTTGARVDTMLKGSKALKAFVKNRVDAGINAAGAVTIHDAAAFKAAWIAYAIVRTNPDTGATYTRAEATADEPNINAFQDSSNNTIHLHESRGEPGTAIHESIHLFANPGWRSDPAYAFNLNEGTTEVFTRVICGENRIRRGTFYPSQRRAVDKLVRKTSRDLLAGAFFQGNVNALKTSLDGATKAGTWTSWTGLMKKGKYSSANALLR